MVALVTYGHQQQLQQQQLQLQTVYDKKQRQQWVTKIHTQQQQNTYVNNKLHTVINFINNKNNEDYNKENSINMSIQYNFKYC